MPEAVEFLIRDDKSLLSMRAASDNACSCSLVCTSGEDFPASAESLGVAVFSFWRFQVAAISSFSHFGNVRLALPPHLRRRHLHRQSAATAKTRAQMDRPG